MPEDLSCVNIYRPLPALDDAENLVTDPVPILSYLLPHGKVEGPDYVGSPRSSDGTALKFHLRRRLWRDWKVMDRSKCGVVSLVMYILNLSFREAIEWIFEFYGQSLKSFTPVYRAHTNHQDERTDDEYADWELYELNKYPILGTYGAPVAKYRYADENGKTLAYVCRFKGVDGMKYFTPFTFCRNVKNPKRSKWIPRDKQRRTLYGLEFLKHSKSRVWVVEGEKCVHAIRQLFPRDLAVTSRAGAKNPELTDWTPLNGRDIVIWPDNDDAGFNFAQTVAKTIPSPKSLRIFDPNNLGVIPKKWDAADALHENREINL